MNDALPDVSRGLQVAIDTIDLEAALLLAFKVKCYAQLIELGTPLLLAEGLRIIPTFHERCPTSVLVADTKIADAGFLEASHAFSQGADMVTVLGIADDATIRGCVEAGRNTTGIVIADMMHVSHIADRAVELELLGVHALCLHTAWDRREHGIEVLNDLREVRRRVQIPLAVAGGVTLANCREVLEAGADILVVGGGVAAQPDPAAAAAAIWKVMESTP